MNDLIRFQRTVGLIERHIMPNIAFTNIDNLKSYVENQFTDDLIIDCFNYENNIANSNTIKQSKEECFELRFRNLKILKNKRRESLIKTNFKINQIEVIESNYNFFNKHQTDYLQSQYSVSLKKSIFSDHELDELPLFGIDKLIPLIGQEYDEISGSELKDLIEYNFDCSVSNYEICGFILKHIIYFNTINIH